jgi:hypothetical protein
MREASNPRLANICILTPAKRIEPLFLFHGSKKRIDLASKS